MTNDKSPAPDSAKPAEGGLLRDALQAMIDVCESGDFGGAPSDAVMNQAKAALQSPAPAHDGVVILKALMATLKDPSMMIQEPSKEYVKAYQDAKAAIAADRGGKV